MSVNNIAKQVILLGAGSLRSCVVEGEPAFLREGRVRPVVSLRTALASALQPMPAEVRETALATGRKANPYTALKHRSDFPGIYL
jgi:hypothetical protein